MAGAGEEDGEGAQTEEQQRTLFSGMLASEFYARHGVAHSSHFLLNSRGMRLFSHLWTPANSPPKALICCCHGFGDDTNWLFQLNCVTFAEHGYAVCALDYEGHGRSEGLRAAFRRAEHLAQDCIDYFKTVRSWPEFQSLPLFLVGVSLGGAIALLIVAMTGGLLADDGSVKGASEEEDRAASGAEDGGQQLKWTGCVLLSPMLRVKEEMKPHWLVVLTLRNLVYLFPDAPIVPTPETIMLSCRDPERLKLALANPHRYAGKPRLGVAVELLRVTDVMAELMPKIDLPFIVLHGEADRVTDCFSSKELFAKASSKDKTLKLYTGGGHQLLQGDLPEIRQQAWGDILDWLKARTEMVEGEQER